MFTYVITTAGIHLFRILVSDIMNWCDVDITWILHLYIVCNESAQRSGSPTNLWTQIVRSSNGRLGEGTCAFQDLLNQTLFWGVLLGKDKIVWKLHEKNIGILLAFQTVRYMTRQQGIHAFLNFNESEITSSLGDTESLLSLNGPARWNDLKRGPWH